MPAPLITAQSISTHLGLPLSTDPAGGAVEKVVAGGLDAAAHQCLFSLGRPRYAALLAMPTDPGNSEPAEKHVRGLLEGAAARLALAVMLPTLNLRALPKGGIITSTGYDASREQLLGPGGVERTQAVLRKDALDLLDALRDAVTPLGEIVAAPEPEAPEVVFVL